MRGGFDVGGEGENLLGEKLCSLGGEGKNEGRGRKDKNTMSIKKKRRARRLFGQAHKPKK